jgi:hypothetical protein
MLTNDITTGKAFFHREKKYRKMLFRLPGYIKVQCENNKWINYQNMRKLGY